MGRMSWAHQSTLGHCSPRNGHFPQEPTCLQTRLKLYKNGLQGSLTSLMGSLTMMATHYEKHCPPTPVSAPTRCSSRKVSFEEGGEIVGRDFWLWVFGTPNGLNQ